MKKLLLFITVVLSFSIYADDNTVTWVYMKDAEPINWEENGVAKGLELEIVEKYLNNHGIKIENKFYPWVSAQKLVETGEVNGMMTPPNARRFAYSVFGKETNLVNYWNIFVKKGNTDMINKA